MNYTTDTNMDKSIILNKIEIHNIEWEKEGKLQTIKTLPFM